MHVAWGLLGRKPEHETLDFLGKVAAAGDERYLVVCGGCGCGRSGHNGFLLCVLQRVVVSMCVVLSAFLESAVADRSGMAA